MLYYTYTLSTIQWAATLAEVFVIDRKTSSCATIRMSSRSSGSKRGWLWKNSAWEYTTNIVSRKIHTKAPTIIVFGIHLHVISWMHHNFIIQSRCISRHHGIGTQRLTLEWIIMLLRGSRWWLNKGSRCKSWIGGLNIVVRYHHVIVSHWWWWWWSHDSSASISIGWRYSSRWWTSKKLGLTKRWNTTIVYGSLFAFPSNKEQGHETNSSCSDHAYDNTSNTTRWYRRWRIVISCRFCCRFDRGWWWWWCSSRWEQIWTRQCRWCSGGAGCCCCWIWKCNNALRWVVGKGKRWWWWWMNTSGWF